MDSTTETIHIKLPASHRQRCRDNGINISGACRKAIRELLEKVEGKDTPVTSCQTAGGSASQGGQK